MNINSLNKLFKSNTDGFKNTDDTSSGYSVYEANDIIKNGNLVAQENTKSISSNTMKTIVDAEEWLPFAADVYKISPDLKDYVIVPVEIIRSDIPNRNGVAFPAEELLRFMPDIGMQTFKSWVGQPTYIEHSNTDITQAKGVIISVAIRKMENVKGDLIRLMHLLAFDRKKDPWLAGEILSRRRTGYSMGSSCETYTCPICNADMRDKGYCPHIDIRTKKSKSEMKIFGDALAFCQSRYVRGFECSSVASPAVVSARNPNILSVK